MITVKTVTDGLSITILRPAHQILYDISNAVDIPSPAARDSTKSECYYTPVFT